MGTKNEKKHFKDWVMKHEWNVFGTLKFQPMRKMDGPQAHVLLRHFWNKLDRVIYGTATKRGCRLVRWCFAHEGSQNDNFHLHFVADSPIELDLYCCLANTVWTKLDRATAGVWKNYITPVVHRDRAADYVIKEFWKKSSDSFDVNLTCSNPNTFINSPESRAAQVQRVAHAMSDNELRAAQAALAMHKVHTAQNLALRDRKQSSKATCK